MHPVGMLGVLGISQRHVLLDVHNGGLPKNESRCVCALQELAGLDAVKVGRYDTLSENQGSGQALSEWARPVSVVVVSLLSVQTD